MSNKLQDEMEEVIHEAGDVLHDVLEGLSEEDIISHSHHKKLEHGVLLFFISMFHIPGEHILKGIAYFLGAAAYFSEFILLTDCFTERVPHQEMFMAYCFGPLYILLGLSYLMGH